MAALTMMVMGGALGVAACASDEGGGGMATSVGPVTTQLSQVGGPLQGFATGRGDDFGLTLSIAGDTIAVGLPDEDSGVRGNPADLSASLSGAVWVFVRSGNGWAQQAYLKATAPKAFEWFGNSVALSGDTLVVGAPEPNGQNGGAAYVFVRNNGVWSEQARLKANNPHKDARFGWSVAIDGNTVVVGAPGLDVGAEEYGSAGSSIAGATYVFARNGTTWTQQAVLLPFNSTIADGYGASVSIGGQTIVVGAPYEDSSNVGIIMGENPPPQNSNLSKSGAAYLYSSTSGTWRQQAYVKASNAGTDDQFGRSVSLSGNVLAIGAPRESSRGKGVNSGFQGDNSRQESGAAYVFAVNAGTWSQLAYIKASSPGNFDHFGRNLALSGKVLVVGAHDEDSAATGVNGNQEDNSSVNSGAAYVFVETSPGTWSHQAYLKASDTHPNKFFGTGVAVGGDQVAVGAPGIISSDSPADVGFGYFFQLTPVN